MILLKNQMKYKVPANVIVLGKKLYVKRSGFDRRKPRDRRVPMHFAPDENVYDPQLTHRYENDLRMNHERRSAQERRAGWMRTHGWTSELVSLRA